MAKKQAKRKDRIVQAEPWLLRFLAIGETPKSGEPGVLECFLLRGRREKVQAAWKKHKELILTDWIKRKPGTRPWHWWIFDAPRWEKTFGAWFDGQLPEPRRRIGGTGTPSFEVLSIVPHFVLGIPVSYVDGFFVEYYNGRAKDIHGNLIPCKHKEGDFKGIALDPDDPPLFESQASYLKRHNLLTQAEEKRLTPGDFETESCLKYLRISE